jgi:hypothetical protein
MTLELTLLKKISNHRQKAVSSLSFPVHAEIKNSEAACIKSACFSLNSVYDSKLNYSFSLFDFMLF